MPNASETAVLTVAGQKYTGWTSVMVRRVYGGACSDFALSVAQPVDTGTAEYSNWKIKNNDQCTITLAGILAFTGYVFVRQSSFNANQHGLMVTGRSLTADAVEFLRIGQRRTIQRVYVPGPGVLAGQAGRRQSDHQRNIAGSGAGVSSVFDRLW